MTAHLDAKAIAALLDPTAYTGLCAEMARDGAKRAREAVEGIAGKRSLPRLREWSGGGRGTQQATTEYQSQNCRV